MADNIIDFHRQQATEAFLSEWQLQILHVTGTLDLMEQHFEWTLQKDNSAGTHDKDDSDDTFYKAEVPLALAEARAALAILKKLCVRS